MEKVEFKVDGTIEVDGVIYTVKLEPKPEPPKVTLSDVFVKNDSRFWIDISSNKIKSDLGVNEGFAGDLSNLPTERDAKRVQAFIALINCAKYFNGDANVENSYYNIWTDEILLSTDNGELANEVRFATEHGSTETVRILKEAGLYEYLFLEK